MDFYPLPTIDAVLQSWEDIFLDAILVQQTGKSRCPLKREKNQLTTTEGLFQSRITPFGLSTSPPVTQRLIDSVLHDLFGAQVFCYIGDIIITTDKREKHTELLRQAVCG